MRIAVIAETSLLVVAFFVILFLARLAAHVGVQHMAETERADRAEDIAGIAPPVSRALADLLAQEDLHRAGVTR